MAHEIRQHPDRPSDAASDSVRMIRDSGMGPRTARLLVTIFALWNGLGPGRAWMAGKMARVLAERGEVEARHAEARAALVRDAVFDLGDLPSDGEIEESLERYSKGHPWSRSSSQLRPPTDDG